MMGVGARIDFLLVFFLVPVVLRRFLVTVVPLFVSEIGRVTKHTTTQPPPPPLIPKNGRVSKILDVDPLEMARQLTIMESKLYLKIRPMECLQRAKEGQGEDDNIKKIINTSNKVRNSILVETVRRLIGFARLPHGWLNKCSARTILVDEQRLSSSSSLLRR